MGRRNKNKRNRGKNKKAPVQKVQEKKEETVNPNDPKALFRKYKIQIGPDGYEAAPLTTPKRVDLEGFKMMDPGGGRILLHPTELKITEGMKYGLVGKNGYGKTTLLRLMNNYEIEGFPKHIRMLFVKQEYIHDERTVIEAVLNADEFRVRLEEQTERIEILSGECPEEQAEEVQIILERLYDMASEVNYDQGEREAQRILDGLGFTAEQKNKRVCDLSGGWRMRVSLAKALFVQPDLLLLDEPTNHLDFPTVLWLQQYLKNYQKTVIVVSHDRTFLNQCITHVIHLHDQKLTYYKGDYNTFEKVRAMNIKSQGSSYEKFQVQIRHLQAYIEKYKDCGPKQEKRAAQVKVKRMELAKLEADCPEEPQMEKKLVFEFPDIGQLEERICTMEDVTFSYDNNVENPLLQHISMHLDEDDKIGMIGANGVGKTTLVKLIMGEIEPDLGECVVNRHCRFAFFAQHHVDQLDLNLSAVDFILQRFADDPDLAENKDRVQTVRRRLGRFHITGQQQTQKIGFLSGGQKSRVAFCVATWTKPHFLILDEPTNHLDLETIDSLIHAVRTFKGGVLLISHDQHFLRCAAAQFWAVTPSGIKIFESFEVAKRFALQRLLPSTVRPKVKKVRAQTDSPKQATSPPKRQQQNQEQEEELQSKEPTKAPVQKQVEEKADDVDDQEQEDNEEEDEPEQPQRRRRRRDQEEEEEDDDDEEQERRRRHRRRKRREEEEEEDDDDGERKQRRRRRKRREEEAEDDDDEDEERRRRHRPRRKRREEEEEEDDDEDDEREKRRRRRGRREQEEEEDDDEDDEREKRRRRRRRREREEEDDDEDEDDEREKHRRRRRRREQEEEEDDDENEERERRRRHRRRRREREQEEEEEEEDDDDRQRRRRRRKRREQEEEEEDDDDEPKQRRRRRKRRERDDEETAI